MSIAIQPGHGQWLTPLRGKVPILDAWNTLPPTTESQVRAWVAAGHNLGLRTGARSGLLVIDDDQIRHQAAGYVPPPTGLIAESPTGGRHYYYRAPSPCPGNSASKLAPHVDTRGEGGQVVYPGSIHPIEGEPYRWVETGDPGVLPAETLAILCPPPRKRVAAPQDPSQGYAAKALASEVHRVRTSSEGTRNDALNTAAFNLGQLVAGGALSESTVREELSAAAAMAGLNEREISGTLASGLSSGAKSPRTVPEKQTKTKTRTSTPAQAVVPPGVLVPGSHVMPPDGDYQEQGAHDFAAQVLKSLNPETLYRRAQVVGELHDGQFRPVSPDRLRSIIDATVRLGAGKESDDGFTVAYRPCSRDHAGLVLAYAETNGEIRELRHLATHPVCLGENFDTARPGWNAAHGVYLTAASVPAPLDLATSRAVLEDLVCDFPFEAPADRANYFGLMLTPILRPAIHEPVPMHLVNSPVERSGKTKLAEIVLGCAVLGKPTPAMQIGEREEEREKRIMSVLLSGQTVLHLDNLGEFLGSAALASLLTSATYMGRLLGKSQNVAVDNGLTVVGTGNNVHATGEVAKRIVPIRLLPATESPETRQDYRHPLLRAYVESERPRVLGALLGLVDAWKQAGRPLGSVGFGGFERWASVVGGIMRVAGYTEWLSTMAEWRGSADDFSGEVGALCKAWQARKGSEWVPAASIYELAVELGLFGWLDKAKTERGKRTSFGMRVLNRIKGRAVGNGLRVESDGVGEARQVRLAKVP